MPELPELEALVRDLSPRQNLDQLFGEHDVLDVDAARLDLVGGEVFADRRVRLLLYRLP